MNYEERNILTIIDYDEDAVVTVKIDKVFIQEEYEDYWLRVIKELGISGENYEWHVTRPERSYELAYENAEELVKDMREAS